FLRFKSALQPGAESVRLNGDTIGVPALREGTPEGEMALGVRPEHVELIDEGGMRGEVFATEYGGTMQVVTIDCPHRKGKAGIPSARRVRIGERVGMRFAKERVVVFDTISGRALQSRLYEEAGHG